MTDDALLIRGFSLETEQIYDCNLYPEMSGPSSISKDPRTAQWQLWRQLPGVYDCSRNKHHDMFIQGDKMLAPRSCTSADIGYAFGESHITRRKPTDPNYESELLLKSKILFDTNTGHRAHQTEHYVFRLQNGEWSYWNTDKEGIVRKKIRDLKYDTKSSTLCPRFTATDQSWVESYGRNIYLGLEFYLGDVQPRLTITHKIQWENGRETVEVTIYDKKGEVEQEGWSEWVREKMNAGYQFLTAYARV